MNATEQHGSVRSVEAPVSSYLGFIDGIRAIAVLSVIAYHVNHHVLPGGFLGVDVFFVISGFVVSASVSGLAAKYPLGRLGAFYARRLIRIMPALIVMLLVTTVVTAMIIPPAWLSLNIERTGILAFFGVSNFFLRNTANDYFSLHSSFNPYTHTWSLGVEEQFYVVFPILFLASAFIKSLQRFTPLLFAGGFVVSLAFAFTRGTADPVNAFYLITSRFWELAAGVLLFQALSWKKWSPGFVLEGPPLLFRWGSAAMLAALGFSLWYPHFGPIPAPGSFVAVFATLGLLTLCLGLREGSGVRMILELPLVQRIGRLSYSLYLWHWPVFVFFRWTVGLESVLQIVAALSITVALASLSYWAVENRLRRSSSIKSKPRWLVVMVALATVVASAGLANFINHHGRAITLSTVAKHSSDWYPVGSPTSRAFPGCSVHVTNEVLNSNPPLAYEVIISTYSRRGCEGEVSGPHVYVLGDSHAVAYEPILYDYVLRTGATVTLSAEPSCGFASLTDLEEDPNCLRHRTLLASTVLREIGKGDVVFLPSLRLPRFSDQDQSRSLREVKAQASSPSARAARATGAAFAASFVERVESAGGRVIFEGVPPLLRTPAFRCADWYDHNNPVCRMGATLRREVLDELRHPVQEQLLDLANRSSRSTLWDPFPLLCPPTARSCPAYREGKPLFFDGDHLSAYANTVLRSSLEEAFLGRS